MRIFDYHVYIYIILERMLRRMRKKAPPFVAVAAFENGRIERAVKHFIMASNLGHEDSMKAL